MIKLDTIIFCNRQYNFMMVMSKLNIAKLIKHEGCYDPLSGKEVCKHVLIEMPEFLSGVYRKILYGLNNEYGRTKLQKLIENGAIKAN